MPGVPGLAILLVPAAALAGCWVAFALLYMPPKTMVLALGLPALAIAAVASGRPRQALLFALAALTAVDVKTYQDFHVHAGGAPGLVITAQLIMLVPLVAIALAERAAGTRTRQRSLRGAWLVMPLLPILAALPSLLNSSYLDLGGYELLRMATFVCLYLYFAIDFRRADLPLVLAGFLVGILLEVPFALLQLAAPGTAISVLGQQSVGLSESVGRSGNLSRVAGTLQHPNLLGSYLVMLLPLALLLAVARRGRSRLRVLARLSLGAGLLLLAITFSRGAWTGIVLAVPLALILAAGRHHVTPAQATAGILLTAAAVLAALALPPIAQRLFASDPRNISFRVDLNTVGLAMWKAHILTGIGLNTFVENAAAFDSRHISMAKVPAHNIYLLWLAETGVAGLLGWVAFLLWSLKRCLRTAASADRLASLLGIGFFAGTVALFVAELFSFSTRIDAIQQGFMVLLGMVVALSEEPSSGP
jgi:O-antigen ligase